MVCQMDRAGRADTEDFNAEKTGAGNGTRTRDINLGKVALYQLSYSRLVPEAGFEPARAEAQGILSP